MLARVSDRLRKCASLIDKDALAGYSESPYVNIPIYQTRMDPSDPGGEVGLGPPSMYNDLERKDRIKNIKDIRRQGPRPHRDIFDEQQQLPVEVTIIQDDGKTDAQGEPRDNVPARGLGENWEQLNRETYRSEGPGGQLVE